MKILVIDDDMLICSLAAISLKKLGGAVVRSAASGVEGLAMAASWSPDVILLDYMMKGMNGPETLKKLRENPSTQKTPIVFMTAKDQTMSLTSLISGDVIGVIEKPFKPERLPEQLMKYDAVKALQKDAPPPKVVSTLTMQLQAEYLASLPPAFERIQSRLALLAENSADQESAAALQTDVHKLHGSAGSYGLTDLSRIFAEWEAQLKQIARRQPLTFEKSEVDAFTAHLNAARQIVACKT